ncbi:MAG: tetratricopeptide repeat-containing glycosyltransferase family protein [Fimbriiglobus sp.]|nr:tetratricopeptide repeat-containing glycosyltransferase family protein [Fimbriiglobus sp.]
MPDTPPTESDVLHHLAEQAFGLGRPDVAGELLRHAARTRPPRDDEKPEALHADGLRLLQAGQLTEAEPRLLRAVQLRPAVADWHEHLAILYARRRQFAEAAVTFRVALRLDPSSAARWNNLAVAYRDLGNLPAAEAAFREAVRRDPTSHDLRTALVRVLADQNKANEAVAEAERATADLPDSPHTWTALGLRRVARGQYAEAVEPFERAASLSPGVAEGQSNLAAVYGKLKRWAECESAARRAISLDPDHAGAWGNLGNCLRDQGRYEEAAAALTRCLDLRPSDAEAAGNFALTFAALGRHTEALNWYDRSLTLRPDNGEVRFNRSLTYLTLGDYTRGWPEYEYRWHTEAMRGKKRTFPVPEWDGTADLTGKTILLVPEQGLGDFIQFVRFAKGVARRGANVVVQAPPELAALAATVPGVGRAVVADDKAELTLHTHAHLLSLPHLLRVSADNIQGEAYMSPPPATVAKWKERLKGVPGFRVGIAWQGNPKHSGDRWRSVPLARFAPLAAVPGVTLCSVQKGHGREQMEDVTFPMFDFGEELTDFADTAGLLVNFDLLIAIDSAVAHLAGATGVRVWTLLAANNDWRWLTDRTDTPWYHSMRLLRQPKLQDWGSVFTEAERQLRAIVAGQG